MHELIIYRIPGWYGRVRKLKIFVDGEEVSQIKTGETLSITISKGAQEIYGKMDWGKTELFSLQGLKSGDKLDIVSWFTLNPLRNLALITIPVRFERAS